MAAETPSDSPSHADANNSEPSREQLHDERVDADEQPFLSHLIELRQRLVRSLLVLFVGFFPVYYFIDPIFNFITGPMREALPGSMIATQVASPFVTQLKVAFYTTVFATVPMLLHQAWGFVSPGLYLREKRFAIPLLASSVALFYLGMTFAYFAVFPLAFSFFVAITPEGVEMMTDISQYLDFVLKIFFAFGIAFEIPVATVLLAMTGLTSARSMARKRPYVIVGCFVVGMLLTPPDIITQVMLAVPAWLLFEAGIILAGLATNPRDEHSRPSTAALPIALALRHARFFPPLM